MPVAARGGGAALPAQADEVDAAGRRGALAAGPGRAAIGFLGSMVFHSPQVSQRPAHFGRDGAAGLADEAGGGFGQGDSESGLGRG